MRTRFRPDHRLTTRMTITIFLLGLVYVAFVAALFVLSGSVLVVLLVAGGVLLAQYWFADRIALFAMRGRLVEPDAQPRVHGIVDRLCAMADMPKPRIAVSDIDLPNAFATGRSTDRAVLCVTTGLLRRLDNAELEGVLAHELSHIAHRDVVVMTVASFFGVLAGLVARFGFYSTMFGGARRRDDTALVVLLVIAISMAVYALSFLLIRALSRYRELAADRAGVMLTGRPAVLAAALIELSGDIGRIPTRDLRTVQAFNAFFVVPTSRPGHWSALLSTHPSLRQRLDQLAGLSAQLGKEV